MKKLLILSGKGGTGKTTVAAAFIDFAKAKAFADCDVDAPNLHLVAGIKTKPQRTEFFGSQKAVIDATKCVGCGACAANCRFDAVKIADGHCTIDEYACEGCSVCLLSCPAEAISMQEDIAGELMLYGGERVFSTAQLKMGRGNSGLLVTEVKSALDANAPQAELAVIDGSPGIGCPVIASISGVDLILIVSEPSQSGISDMKRILKTAEIFGTRTAVCVNKYNACVTNTEAIESFCADSGIPFVGRILYDKNASVAINEGHSLARIACPAREGLSVVFANAMQLLGVTVP